MHTLAPDRLAPPAPLIDEPLDQSRLAGLPEWFATMQRDAAEEFRTLPLPRREEENWRFADPKRLRFDRFRPAPGLPETGAAEWISRSAALEQVAGRYVFGNEILLAAERVNAAGVICEPLEAAVYRHPDLLREHFMSQEFPLGSGRYAALHKARTRSGLLIYVPAGVHLELPVEIVHWAGGEEVSIFPHTLVVTGANASVTVVEFFRSADGLAAGSCGVVDLVAGPGSRIQHVSSQFLNEESDFLQMSAAVVARDAHVKSLQLHGGAKNVRVESVCHLLEPNANSDMLSVSAPGAGQMLDQRTLQHHAAPNTKSDLLYKNVLSGDARTVFSGLIRVDEGAHYTDAYQTCRNLLLSDEAEASSMPGLEINADHVKCSHGSTTGPIEEEAVFYAGTRGIPAEAARHLIAFGFAAEVFDRLGSESLSGMLTGLLGQRFAELSIGAGPH
ncbi:MAG TPA: Fe-S cluster assembly protein SufD [Verrucomicrobiales bacterium]|nr:Fe-S cluster assembly protein SufD [Verrucomicrobiales bacterium]